MRAIPSELLERVKKKWQVPAENADPAMKVYLSRGFINELFQVFTIQEGAELTDVDVTVKRTDTSAEPAEAFALAINDGVAQVKSKPLPYDDQIPWVDRMTVALSATAVAIEFDGYWDRDYATRRFNFVTEEYPWLFYVQGGVLYAKYWEDAEITLATDVVKVCAIRGWLPANGDQSNDQGLIVAYIKTDGLVYYRSYCIQVGGGKLWEVERNVAEVLTAATDLALFRTNDFRIGFLVTIGGVVYWLLTERNYAGMSVWPEQITAAITDVSFDVLPIQYQDAFEPVEQITAGINDISLLVCRPINPEVVSISNALNDYRILIKVNYPLSQDLTDPTLKTKFSVKDSLNTTFAILSTSAGADQTELYLNMVNFSSAKNDMTVTFTSGASEGVPSALTCNNDGCEFDLASFATVFTASIEPPKVYTDEQITASIANVTFEPKQVYYRTMHTDEQITAGISNVSFVVTNVGGNPL